MPKLLLRSIKSESLGVGLGYYYVFKTPKVIHVPSESPSIDSGSKFSGDRTQAKTSVDGLSWRLPCIPVLVAKGRNFPLAAHIRQGFVYLFLFLLFWWWYFFPSLHCGSLLPLLQCF